MVGYCGFWNCVWRNFECLQLEYYCVLKCHEIKAFGWVGKGSIKTVKVSMALQ